MKIRDVASRALLSFVLAIVLVTSPVFAAGDAESLLGDRLIVPGERIGQIRLGAALSEVTSVLGTEARREAGREMFRATTYYGWRDSGIAVIADDAMHRVLWISISGDGSFDWQRATTAEGLRLGTSEAELMSALGKPSREFSDEKGKSVYFDRKGIRFLLATTGPLAGRVIALRVVWPHTALWDGMIIPGERISSVKVGMPLDEATKMLGGGYTTHSAGGLVGYVWTHRGLRVLTKDQRVFSVSTFTSPFLEGADVKYTTREGITIGSSDRQVRTALGTPSIQNQQGQILWWIYQSLGLALGFNSQATVTMIDVIPKQRW